MLFPVLGIGLLRILQATCNKQTSAHMNAKERYLVFGCYFEAAAAVFSLVYLSIAGFEGLQSLPTVLCAAITGGGFLAELMTALAAMQRAPLVLCNLCALGGGIILPSIVSIFLFDEPMSLLKWCGVVLFFVAVWLLSPSEKRQQRLTSGTALVLVANFLINGLLSFLGKFFAMRIEGGNAALYSCLSYAFAALFFGIGLIILLSGKGKGHAVATPLLPRPLRLYGPLLGATCASIVFFTTQLSRTVSLVVMHTIPSAVSVIGCLFLGKWLFRETIVARQLLGALLGVAAGVLVVCF